MVDWEALGPVARVLDGETVEPAGRVVAEEALEPVGEEVDGEAAEPVVRVLTEGAFKPVDHLIEIRTIGLVLDLVAEKENVELVPRVA